MNSPAVTYLLSHLPDLLYRDILQEFFTIPDRLPVKQTERGDLYIETKSRVYEGKLVEQKGYLYRVEAYDRKPSTTQYYVTLKETGIAAVTDRPILEPITPCTITKGIPVNYTDTKPLETTIGRVVANYILFADPYGDIFPYINTPLRGGKLDGLMSDALVRKRITVDQFYHYVRNVNYFLNSPELVSVNLTEKSLVTDPNVQKRKKELIAELKDQIKAGDVSAMSRIESELIKMDKDWLKDDPSLRFMLKGKYFNNVRKKLLLTTGMVESFGNAGEYDFVPNSLEEGYTQEAFPSIANEVRAGSYSRARETAKGGEESKFLLRVFQNTRILEEDCGTTKGLEVDIKSYNVSEYEYRNYFTGPKTYEMLTTEKYGQLIGKRTKFRSPMFCATKGGYCYTCMGGLLKALGTQVLASAVNAVGATFTTSALKSMHNSTVQVVKLGNLDDYLVK